VQLNHLQREISSYEPAVSHYEFLNQVLLAQTIYECTQHLPVDKIRFCFFKKEYNDEGLEPGCYFDIESKEWAVELIEPEYGDYDYSREFRERQTMGASLDEKLNRAIALIHQLGDQVMELSQNKTIERILVSLPSDLTMENNLDSILTIFYGPEVAQRWQIYSEKFSLETSTSSPALISSSVKKL